VDAFSAKLRPPWRFVSNLGEELHPTRFTVRNAQTDNHDNDNSSPGTDQFPSETSLNNAAGVYFSSSDDGSSSSGGAQFTPMQELASVPGTNKDATIWASRSPLMRMCRLGNLGGVTLFHIVGVQRAVSSLSEPYNILQLLMRPSMLMVYLCIVLTMATSMLVNDYYDARSGVDSSNLSSSNSSSEADSSNGCHPLATGEVSMPVAKRFLQYLYAVLLLSLAVVPGIPARLSVVSGAMLTFLYTNYLKPRTWIKNVVCAGLIALSPLTSGSAALHLLNKDASTASLVGKCVSHLGRLVLTLFTGFMSREIWMDMQDYEGDRAVGIRTIPVRYGRPFAGRISLAFLACTFSLAVVPPSWNLVSFFSTGSSIPSFTSIVQNRDSWRWLAAVSGTGMMLRRGIQINKTEGSDMNLTQQAIEEGKLSSLLLLASFL